jgi:hypothetical protein
MLQITTANGSGLNMFFFATKQNFIYFSNYN